jgi:hypothetical protein
MMLIMCTEKFADRNFTSRCFSSDSNLSFLLANAALVYRFCDGKNMTWWGK